MREIEVYFLVNEIFLREVFLCCEFLCIFAAQSLSIMDTKTPEEVALAVSQDLRAKRITHEEAGRRIGKSRTAVSNLLSRKGRFSRDTAELFAREFGYSKDFLLYGKGSLFEAEEPRNTKRLESDPLMMYMFLMVLEEILNVANNESATRAWGYFKQGDYESFIHYLELAEAESGRKFGFPYPIAQTVCEKMKEFNTKSPISFKTETTVTFEDGE